METAEVRSNSERKQVWAEPVRWPRKSIEALAEKVAQSWNVDETTDLHELVRSLGGTIRYRSARQIREEEPVDAQKESGSLVVRGIDDFSIFLPSFGSYVRDRFTIAHELGHYCLHYIYGIKQKRQGNPGELPIMHARRLGSQREEQEANFFAAAFLMPAELFKQKWQLFSGDVVAVAKFFSVSTQAVEIRAETLGL
ncbi:MAG: ImmA/IrrE family metallo-endopeptidase [Alphaproteobacteria bacterium]|nr:MAG: ImmA/IrrE family metallo-endopeptidase [Alphaproteobacteria bacterium]